MAADKLGRGEERRELMANGGERREGREKRRNIEEWEGRVEVS